jgi:hypothetical protein
MGETSQTKPKLKVGGPETRTTLDALHGQKMNQMLEEQTNISQYKEQLNVLETKIKSCTNVTELWALEQQQERLQKKIKSIESGDAMNEYYLRTGNILFSYYDIQAKIHSGATVSTGTNKSKPGSILAILNTLHKDEEGQKKTHWKSEESRPQRNDLLNQYLQIEDPMHAKPLEGTEDDWTECELCGSEMIMCMNEATMTCSKCGNKDFILIDSDKPSYKDPPRELSYYAYKKINHFNEWLAQFQAKESTEIPAAIYDQILLQLKKERISNFGSLKRTKLRESCDTWGRPNTMSIFPISLIDCPARTLRS